MAEVADAALPVFPFRVNWAKGVAERLEWKTDVLGDFVGNEQRRALRLTPRREFEVTLTLWDQDRQFWDLWCHRMAGLEFMLPLWHDSVRATQAAPQGQKTIWVDTRGLEFRIGSYGLLRGLTALSNERFLIAEVHDDRIVTVANLVASWPKGTRVEPLIRGRMTDQTSVTAKSSRASETQAVFEATHEQPYDEGVDSFDQYLGMPVLSDQPNRTDDLTQDFQWAFSESDSLTGRRYRRSDTGRAIVHQKHAWFLKGRTAKAAFRSMLYRLRGSAKPVWLPTYAEDMTVTRAVADGQMSIWVKAFGYAYTGGASSGREHVMIRLHNGTRYYRKVNGTAASGTLTEERLTLTTALPAIPLQQIACVTWIDTSRFENDRIEMTHVNAADGLTTVTGVFQSFRNERPPPTILSAPIPESGFVFAPCGPDAPEQADPCAPVFQGIYLTVIVSAEICNPAWSGDCYVFIPATQPNGVNGRTMGGFHAFLGGDTPYTSDIYENTVPGDPRCQGQLMERFTYSNFNMWRIDYYYPTAVFNGVYVKPSARYCGSVGQDEGLMRVTYQYADSPPVFLGPKPAGGNYDINFP